MGASSFSTTLAALNNVTVFAQDDGFIGSWGFFGLGALILVGLGGLLFYLRNKQSDD